MRSLAFLWVSPQEQPLEESSILNLESAPASEPDKESKSWLSNVDFNEAAGGFTLNNPEQRHFDESLRTSWQKTMYTTTDYAPAYVYGSAALPWIGMGLAAATPTILSGARYAWQGYRIAWNNGGNVNFLFSAVNESVANDGDITEMNLLAIVGSGAVPGGATLTNQTLIGAAGGVISFDLKHGFRTYGNGKDGADVLMGASTGALNSLYPGAPLLVKNPMVNQGLVNVATGEIQKLFNERQK